jgi:hypothetical protein
MQRGGKGHYDMLRTTLLKPLSILRFNELTLPGKKQLLSHVLGFLVAASKLVTIGKTT